jgi:hypothetical protein
MGRERDCENIFSYEIGPLGTEKPVTDKRVYREESLIPR